MTLPRSDNSIFVLPKPSRINVCIFLSGFNIDVFRFCNMVKPSSLNSLTRSSPANVPSGSRTASSEAKVTEVRLAVTDRNRVTVQQLDSDTSDVITQLQRLRGIMR